MIIKYNLLLFLFLSVYLFFLLLLSSSSSLLLLFYQLELLFNPLTAVPEIFLAEVYGECVLKQYLPVFNGLITIIILIINTEL